METALTPLEFARRARRLYADREAVVDNDLRLTYGQFFERCDRWSAALQRLGGQPEARGGFTAPNILALFVSFFSVLHIGEVLTPFSQPRTSDDLYDLLEHIQA